MSVAMWMRMVEAAWAAAGRAPAPAASATPARRSASRRVRWIPRESERSGWDMVDPPV